ncbi:hypothetical protein EsH8_VIII_001034 [Colletotrichum jinshuiense]
MGQHGLALLGIAAIACVANGLSPVQTYPIPSEVPQSTSYTINVRAPNEDWQSLATYLVNLHEINITTGSAKVHPSSLALFDFDGSVDISVTYNSGIITTPRIRPESYGINPAVDNNTLTFTLSEPKDIVIQTTGSVFDVLHLVTNRLPTDIPSSNDTDIIFYGPGYHVVNEALAIPSGKTLYLAPGAVLKASVTLDNATSASIRGHGILYKSPNGGISAQGTKDVTIDSITVLNPTHYTFNVAESDTVTVKNLRSFSATQWGDGIDLYCSKNVLLEKIFMRNSDDCIAIYNHRNEWYGDSSNITIQNSALWADVAHPINIGTHGNSVNPETMSDITIRNIDIMDMREYQMGYQGAIAINPGDSNLVKNVLIEDVRVEDFRMGQIITMMVMYNQKYNTSPGRGVSNITVRNLVYNGSNANTAIMTGYDGTRGIEFVRFENLTVNGLQISDKMKKPGWYMASDFVPMYVNEHVRNLTFV